MQSFMARLDRPAGAARLALAALFLATASPLAVAEEQADGMKPAPSEALFLDRLSMAESGGRQFAKNPRSTALGPFQFIDSTFFDVVMRNFPELAEGKSAAEISQLRVDPKVARDAALAYTRENAAFLQARGHAPEAGYLRLAFLVGPSGAAKLLSAEPKAPVAGLLSQAAIEANPFMDGMTAEDLIARAKREADGLGVLPVTARKGKAAGHGIKVRCSLARASCQKWLALAKKRAARTVAQN